MLELVNVSKQYQSKKPSLTVDALKSINIEFKSKGLVFLLGKSGSGKSTLLNLIAGIDNTTEGTILFNKEDICKYSSKNMDKYRNYHIGMIFQEFNLIEGLTVKENITIALYAQKKAQESDLGVSEVLKSVDLSGYEDRHVNSISGGERQRIAIARALIKKPSIILADEPTGNLDSENSKLVFDYLKKISKDTLVIVASHDKDYADEYADRIINLVDGSVTYDKYLTTTDKMMNLSPKSQNIINRNNLSIDFHFKFAFRNIMIKKARMILNIITFSLALFLVNIGLVYFLYDFDKVTYNVFQESSIDEIDIFKTTSTKDGINYVTFTNEDIRDISIQYPNIELRRLISKPLGTNAEFNTLFRFTNFSSGIPADQFDIRTLLIIEEEDNMIFLSGDYPNEKGEVAISDYLADMIIKYQLLTDVNNHFDLIEKELSNGNVSLNISGIYDTGYEQNYNQDHTVSDLYDNGFMVSLNTLLCTLAMSEETYEFIFNSQGKVLVKQEGRDSYNNIVMANEDYDFNLPLVGEMAKEDNEIVLSLTFLDEYISEMIIPGDITGDNDAIGEYLDETITLDLDAYGLGEKTFVIVGIVDDFNQGSNIQFVFNNKIFNYLEYNNYIDGKIIGLKLHFDNLIMDYNDIVSLLNDNQARHYTKYSFELYSMGNVMKSVSPLLASSGLVLILISGVMISSYISYIIQTKKREIGILRSMGISSVEVGKIYFLQSFFILLVAYLISLVFTNISVFLQNKEIVESWNISVKILYFDAMVYIISFVFIVFITMISTLIPVYRSIVLQPIRAIRQGNQ